MIRWGAVIVMLSAGPSQAMLQCTYYDELVGLAPVVIQIENPTFTPPDAQGTCFVAGTVARVFAGEVALGTQVVAMVPCVNVDGIAGPIIWTDPQALAAARVIELHMDNPSIPAGYGAGIVLLDALTDTPAWKPMCDG